jgi:hypothetical protein
MAGNMNLIPKNWASFQHYKDRAPPWIKLHKDLLDDRTFQRLPVASRALAPMLWLLASESKDGSFDGSVEELSFRLRVTDKEIQAGLEPLIQKGFFLRVHDACATLADGEQLAVPEREAETETKKEAEPRATRIPPNFNPEPEPDAERGIDRRTELLNFRDYWTAKAGKDGAKLDWQATWRQWARKAHRKPADVVRMTVDGSDAPDPALQKIVADAAKAVPMPEHLRKRAAA